MKDSDLNFYPGEGYYTGKLTYTLLDDRRRPADVHEIEYEQLPKQAFEISTDPIIGNEVVANITLLNSFLTAESFTMDIHQPVTIKAWLKPKNAATRSQKKILETFKVTIKPNATLRWKTEDPEHQDGNSIRFPEFQGPEWLTLRVWIETWDPRKKALVRSTRKFDYSHYLLPASLPVESTPYFGMRRSGQNSIRNPGTHELTDWGREEAFNEETKPAEVATAIRVRVWEPGSIAERSDPPGFGPDPQRVEVTNPDSTAGVVIPLNVERKHLKNEFVGVEQSDGTSGLPVEANEKNSEGGVKFTFQIETFMPGGGN
jgi:hypothetical protein